MHHSSVSPPPHVSHYSLISKLFFLLHYTELSVFVCLFVCMCVCVVCACVRVCVRACDVHVTHAIAVVRDQRDRWNDLQYYYQT